MADLSASGLVRGETHLKYLNPRQKVMDYWKSIGHLKPPPLYRGNKIGKTQAQNVRKTKKSNTTASIQIGAQYHNKYSMSDIVILDRAIINTCSVERHLHITCLYHLSLKGILVGGECFVYKKAHAV